MTLKAFLERMTTNNWSLPRHLRIAGIKARSTKKADMVAALESYLGNEKNLRLIWDSLKPLERDLLEEYILSRGEPDEHEIKEIYEKHGARPKKPFYSYYDFEDIFDDYSKARLFFTEGIMPPSILTTLDSFIEREEITFTGIADKSVKEDDDLCGQLVIGDSFARDIVKIIKLVNTGKLSTRDGGLPTKTAMVKINEVLEHKEPLPDTYEYETIGEIRTVEQTARIYGLCMLLLEAGILEDEAGHLVAGEAAEEFLRADTVARCKMLLQAYLKSTEINELNRIRGIKIRPNYMCSLGPCRELVIGDYLARCPAGNWVAMEELLSQIKRWSRNFLNSVTGGVFTYNEYERAYYSRDHGWREIEGRLVEVMLLEYLSAMGIVDVAYTVGEEGDYETKEYLSVKYLRLTPLGAYVLGASDDYVKEETGESGLVVKPDYEIVLNPGSMMDVHEVFLDKWAEKVSEGAASVYKLTFKAIARALDQGITVREIIEYLQEFATTSIPANVMTTLEEWERESGRITIRTVTILETDDPYLLKELRSYRAIDKAVLGELSCAVEIDGKSARKLKREIEKQNRYCSIRIP